MYRFEVVSFILRLKMLRRIEKPIILTIRKGMGTGIRNLMVWAAITKTRPEPVVTRIHSRYMPLAVIKVLYLEGVLVAT